jgi:hypothetical protein
VNRKQLRCLLEHINSCIDLLCDIDIPVLRNMCDDLCQMDMYISQNFEDILERIKDWENENS